MWQLETVYRSLWSWARSWFSGWFSSKLVPESVNYHFHRQCNYACEFCFHTAKTSYIAPLEDAKAALRQLKEAGMQKINFSGGEPFLHPDWLGKMCCFAKRELALPSVSIVSNGSLIKERWIEKWGRYVDILAISCDSFDEETNKRIGRGRGAHVEQLRRVALWCERSGIQFKINTTVCSYNVSEDMTREIAQLNPKRWKVFQVLIVEGENDGRQEAKRNALHLTITAEQFNAFIARHAACKPVAEDNTKMRASYLILDEYLRFLDCSGGGKKPSASILEVGVQAALANAGFDKESFEARGGRYDWTRERPPGECASDTMDIEDLAR